MGQNDIRSYQKWQEYSRDVASSTPVNLDETALEKRARMDRLEADPEAWFKYYFDKFAGATPAPFHLAATKRVIENPEWYEVRAWSRENAKSTRTMFETIYLNLVGHPVMKDGKLTRLRKRNVLLISNSKDNAERLLLPYKVQYEKNNRIINDYGQQETIGTWEAEEFVTKTDVAYRAVGAGQSPRGSRNQELRPDIILIDDMDTDQDCRNPKIINDRWDWVEEALMGTRSISRATTVIFCGNIIAKDSCITRAIKIADHTDIINIRDENGKSTWPSKNTEADIDRVLAKISYSAAQKEYFNNPVTEGTVFKSVAYKPALPISAYEMLVCYTDPSYKESGDFKSTVLVGLTKGEYHIIKTFCKQTTIADMVYWHYDIMDIVGPNACYYYMEELFMQDMFYNEFLQAGIATGRTIPIMGDTRTKPEKFMRIESLLEPLNRRGMLYFNESEKDNPHMSALEDQFIAFEPGMKTHDDGPDSVEGAIWIINNKIALKSAAQVTIIPRTNIKSTRF